MPSILQPSLPGCRRRSSRIRLFNQPPLIADRRPSSSVWLALRSLLWAIALPGVIAGYVPWTFFGLDRARFALTAGHLLGYVCIGLGLVLLAACIWEFARSGRGTLSPMDPPRHLVVRGLYRYVRNPMYLAVTILLLGEALVARSRAILLYWVVWFLFVNVFVIGYEEPTLRRLFGASYDEYARQVGRWIPGSRFRDTQR